MKTKRKCILENKMKKKTLRTSTFKWAIIMLNSWTFRVHSENTNRKWTSDRETYTGNIVMCVHRVRCTVLICLRATSVNIYAIWSVISVVVNMAEYSKMNVTVKLSHHTTMIYQPHHRGTTLIQHNQKVWVCFVFSLKEFDFYKKAQSFWKLFIGKFIIVRVKPKAYRIFCVLCGAFGSFGLDSIGKLVYFSGD